MTKAEQEMIAALVGNIIREYSAPLVARLAKLEAMQPAAGYGGTWEAGKTYPRGWFVTAGGSLWLTVASTDGKPGECGDWRLVVKRGEAQRGFE